MPIALKRVLRLAEGQWGVIARWQLEQCGLSAAAISRWTASGKLHRIYPGVYAVGHRALRTEATAARNPLRGPGSRIEPHKRRTLVATPPLLAQHHPRHEPQATPVAHRHPRPPPETRGAGDAQGTGRRGSATLNRALALHRPQCARTLEPARGPAARSVPKAPAAVSGGQRGAQRLRGRRAVARRARDRRG
jgi:hypothetical protein